MKKIAYDTETHLIRNTGLIAPKMVCLAWTDGEEEAILGREDALEWFRVHIQNPEILWIGHNTAFDMGVMANELPESIPWIFRAYDENRVTDTMIREKLLSFARGKFVHRGSLGLAALAKKYFGQDRSSQKKGPDSWRLRYAELEDVPVELWPDAAREYPLDDVRDTLRLYESQRKIEQYGTQAGGTTYQLWLPDGSLTDEYPQSRADMALQLMSIYGVSVDPEEVHRLRTKLELERRDLAQTLVDEGILDSSTWKKSDAAVRERVFDFFRREVPETRSIEVDTSQTQTSRDTEKKNKINELIQEKNRSLPEEDRLPLIPSTDAGGMSVSKDTLDRYDDPVLTTLVRFNEVSHKIGTYLDKLSDAADQQTCITPGYDVLKETGRTSSFGFNIQNVPRSGGERACFRPRAGNLYVVIDYSTLELRAWAQVCISLGIESEMAKALRAGRDLHAEFGAAMLGETYEEFMKALAGDLGPEAKARAKRFRSAAKGANFGLPVGMGVRTLRQTAQAMYGVDFEALGVDPAVLREAWYAKWTEATEYFAHIKSIMKPAGRRKDDSTGLWLPDRKASVRQLFSGRIRAGCYYSVAANTYFQGLAADGAKLALWWAARESYVDTDSDLFGCRPVIFVHDEIVLEAPEHQAQRAAVRLEEVMVEAMSTYIPDVPIECDVVISDRWVKDAESKRNEDGTLTVHRHSGGKNEAPDK